MLTEIQLRDSGFQVEHRNSNIRVFTIMARLPGNAGWSRQTIRLTKKEMEELGVMLIQNSSGDEGKYLK